MKNVTVLGLGSKRRDATAPIVTDAAMRAGVVVTVERVTDDAEIAGCGIASTPGQAVDAKVVHAGGLPKAEDVARWITA